MKRTSRIVGMRPCPPLRQGLSSPFDEVLNLFERRGINLRPTAQDLTPMLRFIADRRPPPERPRATGATGDAQDMALIARVAARDLLAFETLYRAYHPRLSRFLGLMTPRRTV